MRAALPSGWTPNPFNPCSSLPYRSTGESRHARSSGRGNGCLLGASSGFVGGFKNPDPLLYNILISGATLIKEKKSIFAARRTKLSRQLMRCRKSMAFVQNPSLLLHCYITSGFVQNVLRLNNSSYNIYAVVYYNVLEEKSIWRLQHNSVKLPWIILCCVTQGCVKTWQLPQRTTIHSPQLYVCFLTLTRFFGSLGFYTGFTRAHRLQHF